MVSRNRQSTLAFTYDERDSLLRMHMHIQLKEPVNAEILTKAINNAMKRYPYYCVKIEKDMTKGYHFVPNDAAIVVSPCTAKKTMLHTPEGNYHLLCFEYDGNDIHMHVNHALMDGRGFMRVLKSVFFRSTLCQL